MLVSGRSTWIKAKAGKGTATAFVVVILIVLVAAICFYIHKKG